MRAKAVLVLTFLFFSIYNAQAANQKVLYSFTGVPDGSQPYAGVIFDSAGNLYGVTEFGGLYDEGTVFQLSPSGNGWTETVLYSFTYGGPDGAWPVGGLAIDEAGNLYGTASGGWGDSSCGTVFRLSPSGGGWTFTVLHTFTGDDGCTPFSNLRYGNGYVQGTTAGGGRGDYGTMFHVSTSADDYGFTAFNGRSGNWPWGYINSWGYGTTFKGGRKGYGNVYEWEYTWHEIIKNIHGFNSSNKGGYHPVGELLNMVVGGVKTMYGTNVSGGIGGRGTVYQLTASQRKFDVWTLSVLHSFSGPDGGHPYTGLTADSAGNLYGTTAGGGADPYDQGTVFKLTPGPKKKWTHTLLYSFTDGTDGGEVYSGVVLDNAGNLYGTTWSGGAYNQGVVYEITP